MAIIDAHAHIYPDKIAQRAVDSVRDFYGLGEMFCKEGTGQALIDAGQPAGITHYLVHSVAVKAKTVESINTFIAQQCAEHPEFVGFATMHQDYENPEAEIDRAKALGLHGVKLHPDTQRVNADDPRLMDVYEICQAKDMAVVLHTGDYRYDFSHPRRVVKILRAFPDLRVNAAHFGGWSIYDIGADLLCGENCYVDTCSSFELTGIRHGKELINMYGRERVLFGSDFPMWSPAKELSMLREMNFPQDVFEDLTWHNFERFAKVTLK